MRALWWFVVCAVILFAPSLVRADATVNNFTNSGTFGVEDEISHNDVVGEKINIDGGVDLQCQTGMPNCPLGTIYLYGTNHRCGSFWWYANSQYCGTSVYSTTDYKNFTYHGVLFDVSSSFWQNRCYQYCLRPHVMYNAANNNYVVWVNEGPNPPYSTPQGFSVLTCTSPTGGCTIASDPINLTYNGGGDFATWVDSSSGIAYIAYNAPSSGNPPHIYAQQLNADFTDGVGAAVDTGATGEGVAAFDKGGMTYVVYGPLCPYCGGISSSYVAASTPLGTYGSPVQITDGSCGTQNRSINKITAGGQTTYLFSADQNDGIADEAMSNIYFQPLSFTGSAINPFTCQLTVTIPGLPNNAWSPTIAPANSALDQSDVADAFTVLCHVNGTVWVFVTFVPQKTPLTYIGLPLGTNNTNCVPSGALTSACPAMDGNISVSLTTVSGNGPGTTLASASLPASDFDWNTKWTNVPISYPVTPGTTYGILLKTTGQTTNACLSYEQSSIQQYLPGTETYTPDGGTTWIPTPTKSLMFATFSSPPPPVIRPLMRGVFGANDNFNRYTLLSGAKQ